mmetsp:Transcript_68537/g.190634  ORF Transcript_68537/g.190634 Transcript_68537/m.190634 type:complete len:912 (+) Transcript_68537:1557-4292(+)
MHLGDGRRILSAERLAKEPWRETEGGIVKMHPDFRMWVLANRPGFPFLGNNFFRECGDVFTVHTVDNPDLVSEASLLANYAPTTSPLLLDKMAKAFARLRDLHQAGVVAYPYSIREAVAVVRHLEQFPEDGLVTALNNVLAFDSYSPDLRAIVAEVFQSVGVPLPKSDDAATPMPKIELGTVNPLSEQIHTETWGAFGDGGVGEVVASPFDLKLKRWGLARPTDKQWGLEASRIAEFSEELGRLRVWGSKSRGGAAAWKDSAIGMTATSADQLHVLCHNPCELHSFSGLSKGGGIQRTTAVLGDMMEYRVQHDLPRLVPLQNSENGEADRLGVVFPNAATVIIVDLGGRGACHAVEIPPAPAVSSGGGGSGGSNGGGGGIMSSILSSRSLGSGSSNDASTALKHVVSLPGGSMALFAEGEPSMTIMDMNAVSTDREAPTGCHVHLSNDNGPVGVVNLDVMGPSVWAVRGTDGSINLVRWPEGTSVVEAARQGLMQVQPMAVDYLDSEGGGAVAREKWTGLPGSARAARTETTHAPSPPGLAPDGRYLTHAAAEVQVLHGFPSAGAKPSTVHVHTAPAEHRSVSRPLSVTLDPTLTTDDPMPTAAPAEHRTDASLGPCVVSLVRRGGRGGDDGARAGATLETVDMNQRSVRSVPLQRSHGNGPDPTDPDYSPSVEMDEAYIDDRSEVVDLCEVGKGAGKVATLQRNGLVRLWQLDSKSLDSELNAWKKMFGRGGMGQADGEGGGGRLGSEDRITFRDKDGKSVPKTGLDRPKEGKHDENNDPHVGGNTWAGGTGGSDTAGLGGRGGPYRLDKGHQVHQVSDAAKAEVSEEAQAMAREMAEEGLRKRLEEIDMGEGEWEAYLSYFDRIQTQVQQLRVVLEAIENKVCGVFTACLTANDCERSRTTTTGRLFAT